MQHLQLMAHLVGLAEDGGCRPWHWEVATECGWGEKRTDARERRHNQLGGRAPLGIVAEQPERKRPTEDNVRDRGAHPYLRLPCVYVEYWYAVRWAPCGLV